MEFTVDETGRVCDPKIVEETPEGVFGPAALEAVSAFRYIPRVVDGQRVATSGIKNKITFQY